MVSSFTSETLRSAHVNRWQIMWQDSLLSVTFDRLSSTMAATDSHYNTEGRQLNYLWAMRYLCKIGLGVVQERSTARSYSEHLSRISSVRDETNQIINKVVDHLTSVGKCKTIKDQLEFWNFHMHRSYILSELTRPTLTRKREISSRKRTASSALEDSLRHTCIASLAFTVEAFLGLQNVTKFATQSWAAVHRSLSSALLLGIIGEPAREPRVRLLLSRLLTVMSGVQSSIDPLEKSAPITRSLEALVKLIPQYSNAGTFFAGDPQQFPGFEMADVQTSGSTSVGSTSSPAQASTGTSPMSMMHSIMWGNQGPAPGWSFDLDADDTSPWNRQ
jgi:hypothetical protein